MTKEYRRALQEVYEIIKLLDAKDFAKLPVNFIKMIENKRDKSYNFNISDEIPFSEQELMEETKAILAVIYRMYLLYK